MFAMAAVLFTLILLVGGLSADYGTTYLAHSKFRNAADAAALAGANERQRNPAGGEPAVRAVALQYLALHGYVPDAQTTITVTLVPAGAGTVETVRVDATRAQPTFFLRLVGISKVDFAATTEAQNGGGFLDVVVSLDITASMDAQMSDMILAAKAFLAKINPSLGNPNGPQMAINVFNGTSASNFVLQNNSRIAQTAIFLTQDSAALTKIIDGTGVGACPTAWPTPQPRYSDTGSQWPPRLRICPLQDQGGSGTYVGNGFEMAFSDVNHGHDWNIWDPSLGGRPGGKKVLVVFTDGANNVSGASEADANTATVAAANSVKRGPDGQLGTSDDVEIYTIGFFASTARNSRIAPGAFPCSSQSLPRLRCASASIG